MFLPQQKHDYLLCSVDGHIALLKTDIATPSKSVIRCEMDLSLRVDDGWLVFSTILPPSAQ